jgi:predicted aspartyl protease
MSFTRRHAAAGLAAGAAVLPFSQAVAQGIVESPEVEEPPAGLDTGRDAYEHMLAPVTINGQGPFQFLMDTGANTSCVSRALADRLALTPGPAANVHTVVGVRQRPSVVIDHLQVGSRSRKKVKAASLPFSSDGVDGVLGVDWLKGQRLVMGFKTRRLEITRSREDRPEKDQVVVPARRRLGQLTIVDADLSGRRISAIIDSGAQVTLCNAPLRKLVFDSERRKGLPMEHQKVKLETLAGEPFQGEMLYLPFVRLGGLHLGNVPVVYADMHVFDIWGLKTTPALVLGMDLLTQFETVSLDFGRSQVRFDIAEPQGLPALPSKLS